MFGGCQDISFKTNGKLFYLAYLTVRGSCLWVLEVAYSTLMNPALTHSPSYTEDAQM